MNCYRIRQKSLNFVYPFKFYSNFTNKNVSWLHFSWATQYIGEKVRTIAQFRRYRFPAAQHVDMSLCVWHKPHLFHDCTLTSYIDNAVCCDITNGSLITRYQ